MFSVYELLLNVLLAATANFSILSLIVVEFSKRKRAASDFSDADAADKDLRATSAKANATFLVVGNKNSGKTTFINNFNDGKVNFKEMPATAGVGDLAQFQSAKAAFVICDSTNLESAHASEWKEMIASAVPGIPVVIVATALDVDLLGLDQAFKLGAKMSRISRGAGFACWDVVSNVKKDSVQGMVDYFVTHADKIPRKQCVEEAVEVKCSQAVADDVEDIESCPPKKATPENHGETCNRRRRLRSRGSLEIMGEI